MTYGEKVNDGSLLGTLRNFCKERPGVKANEYIAIARVNTWE